MSGFDEWLSSDDFNIDKYSNRRCVFEAGAQSRQAEIDELQTMYEKQGLYAFELQETVNDQLIRIGQLEKRIDKLIPLLERYNYTGWIKILKGNQNE